MINIYKIIPRERFILSTFPKYIMFWNAYKNMVYLITHDNNFCSFVQAEFFLQMCNKNQLLLGKINYFPCSPITFLWCIVEGLKMWSNGNGWEQQTLFLTHIIWFLSEHLWRTCNNCPLCNLEVTLMSVWVISDSEQLCLWLNCLRLLVID